MNNVKKRKLKLRPEVEECLLVFVLIFMIGSFVYYMGVLAGERGELRDCQSVGIHYLDDGSYSLYCKEWDK